MLHVHNVNVYAAKSYVRVEASCDSNLKQPFLLQKMPFTCATCVLNPTVTNVT